MLTTYTHTHCEGIGVICHCDSVSIVFSGSGSHCWTQKSIFIHWPHKCSRKDFKALKASLRKCGPEFYCCSCCVLCFSLHCLRLGVNGKAALQSEATWIANEFKMYMVLLHHLTTWWQSHHFDADCLYSQLFHFLLSTCIQ